MTDSERPGGESTVPYPDDIDTVDALGGKARSKRTDAVSPDANAAPIKIGRYQLLEVVGSGGMGIVWGAWDPELERRVALKLVRFGSSEARARMLREGQVLAQLSHPNIVPIFDLGELGEQVYLVMEFVRGTTLRAFVGEKPEQRVLLDAYRQAGEGLAAAHDASVIHRDFKPDNAVRGQDGRVRVLDFGIAREDSEGDSARPAGTPKYMSPEHARGEAATAAGDQYAFCVSLREAFDGGEGLPTWIAAIVKRGTDPDPARRFPSMRGLLDQLAHDPARRWKRGSIGVVAIGAALGAFAIGRARSSGAAIEPCTGGTSELASDWSAAPRARMTSHLHSLGSIASSEGDRLANELDDYAASWVAEHRRACLAHERKELTPQLYADRLGCLTRTRSQLAATVELMSGTDAPGLAPALLAARALPDVRACGTSSGLVIPPPAAMAAAVNTAAPHVERALVRAVAGRVDAIDDARKATAEARATGYAPLIARALLAEGRATQVSWTDARAMFAEAMRLALGASDDTTAVEAYARWIFELGRAGETQIDNWSVMTEIASRNGPPGRFARALMYNNRAVAKADDKAGERELLIQAQAIAGEAPELELVAIEKNLASLETDPDASVRRLTVARHRLETALGPHHPDVLLTRIPIALLMRDRSAARAELDTVCRGFDEWKHAMVSQCAFEAAWLADEDGDRAAATTWMSRVAANTTGDSREAISTAYLAVANTTPDRAARLAELERFVAEPHEIWWSRVEAADALVVLAIADPHAWERVVPMIESVDKPFYARRLARARAMRAEQLARSQPDEARRLAELALAWYRGGGDKALVERLEKITSVAAGSRSSEAHPADP